MPLQYYAVYKPFGMLSQFSKETETQITLQDLAFDFPKDVYPLGRLDQDSEGLLILSNDKRLNNRLLDPNHEHERTYWAQVEGIPSKEALAELSKGVVITIDGKPYKTRPCKIQLFDNEPLVPPRNPPIRFRKHIPTAWVSMTLHEGKNRQVRKMFAKVGFPVLRLMRTQIGKLSLDPMQVGEVRELDQIAVFNELLTR